MRGRSSRHPDGSYRAIALHARNATLLAATAHGKLAVDAIYANIGDLEGLAKEAEDAAASGFALKACIHPSHVAVIRDAFRADDRQVAWARRVLAAAREEGGQGSAVKDRGAVKVDGQMIDAPLLRQAEAILASVDEAAG
jgi:citrate lyase subunit beta/citryl-CoA lyase